MAFVQALKSQDACDLLFGLLLTIQLSWKLEPNAIFQFMKSLVNEGFRNVRERHKDSESQPFSSFGAHQHIHEQEEEHVMKRFVK